MLLLLTLAPLVKKKRLDSANDRKNKKEETTNKQTNFQMGIFVKVVTFSGPFYTCDVFDSNAMHFLSCSRCSFK